MASTGAGLGRVLTDHIRRRHLRMAPLGRIRLVRMACTHTGQRRLRTRPRGDGRGVRRARALRRA
jgi:hypothetical protein